MMVVDVVSEGLDCPKGEGNRFRITPFATPGYFINIFISQRISNSSCLSLGCLFVSILVLTESQLSLHLYGQYRFYYYYFFLSLRAWVPDANWTRNSWGRLKLFLFRLISWSVNVSSAITRNLKSNFIYYDMRIAFLPTHHSVWVLFLLGGRGGLLSLPQSNHSTSGQEMGEE